MKKIQFGNDIILKHENKSSNIILKYYILESPIGLGYSELKSYGIEIMRIDRCPGMQDMNESKQIEGVFFSYDSAAEFISFIRMKKVMPSSLIDTLENYIKENVVKLRS